MNSRCSVLCLESNLAVVYNRIRNACNALCRIGYLNIGKIEVCVRRCFINIKYASYGIIEGERFAAFD